MDIADAGGRALLAATRPCPSRRVWRSSLAAPDAPLFSSALVSGGVSLRLDLDLDLPAAADTTAQYRETNIQDIQKLPSSFAAVEDARMRPPPAFEI